MQIHSLELPLHFLSQNPAAFVTDTSARRGLPRKWRVGIEMSKRSILVVDDDHSVRSYLSDFLTSCGYAVECVESGDQAVTRLTSGQVPSVVVLDIVMPGINGI